MAVATPGDALTVFNYSATVNERFDSGFPGAPVANTSGSFIGAGLDLSGIGWRANSTQFAVTLVSPQSFITAGHVAPGIGDTLVFLNQDGVLKSYTVGSLNTVIYNSQSSDIVLGTLTVAIPTSDHVTSYPVLDLGSFGAYVGLGLTVYGQNGRMGTNTIDALGNFDFKPIGSPDGNIDSIFLQTDYDPVTGEAQGQGGDSGSPSFVISSGSLALVGVHSAINGSPPPDLTFDSFIPPFIAQLNSFMSSTGFTITAVPEPATIAVWAGVVALVMIIRRRRSTT